MWLESFLRAPRKVYRGWKAFFVCLGKYIVVGKLQNKPPEEVGGPEVIQGGTPGAWMNPEIRKNKK